MPAPTDAELEAMIRGFRITERLPLIRCAEELSELLKERQALREAPMLWDVPPGRHVWDVCDECVSKGYRGFVFNTIIVRRLFDESAEQLYEKFHQLQANQL